MFKSKVLVLAGVLSCALPALADIGQMGAGHSRFLPAIERAEGTSQLKPTIGVSTGFAGTESRRGGTMYGIEAAYQPVIPFGLGVVLGGYVADHSDTKATLTRTKLMAKGTYNFGGAIAVLKNAYVGSSVGAVNDNESNQNDVNFGFEPTVGFDIPLKGDLNRWSIGANANYLFVGGAKDDVLALNGIAKYLF